MEMETEAQVLFRHEREGDSLDDDFDPLEMDRYSTMQQLSRALMESTSDISSIQGMLGNLVRESETLLVQQSRVNTELQEGLMRTRMVSFSGLVPRMRRLVRQTANELGKKVELNLVGEHGEMDRTLLERITAPLEHMLRNAISHGIEHPKQRKQAGKPAAGVITISIFREAGDVVIQIEDDGAGMDLDAIRSKAIDQGLMDKDARLSDHDVLQFVLESGFSTAQKVTQVSGRGVGMDVVSSEVKQLGGSMYIDSTRHQGASFTLRLPFTLAVNQALLFGVGEENFAVPLNSVEGIVRMTPEELEHYLEDPEARYFYVNNEYQVQGLSSMLGMGGRQIPAGIKMFPVLLIKSGEHRAAIQVERLMGSREIVVKSVGPQISTVRGISGATILGNGDVVLILDIGSIIRMGSLIANELASEAVPAQDMQQVQRTKPLVMVVDDSITVRKVTSRLLGRNNMDVITAKDGVDAVTVLQEQLPDVMLLDIEMPRMDGFELATYMRNEPRLKDVPIIMITSRTGEKHRKRAESIGVSGYLGKPYQENELLDNIQQQLDKKE
jgi:chemosensory pili system protein ChpA (sensor histidine kinase/response regulator)